MNKTICFAIEGEVLYLDQVLVEFNELPIFYVCTSGKKYYIALCVDTEDMKYFVAETKLEKLLSMLKGTLPMRNLITENMFYWEVTTAEDYKDDIVLKKNIAEISLNDLPDEGACFQILTPQMKQYVEKLENELLSSFYSELRSALKPLWEQKSKPHLMKDWMLAESSLEWQSEILMVEEICSFPFEEYINVKESHCEAKVLQKELLQGFESSFAPQTDMNHAA